MADCNYCYGDDEVCVNADCPCCTEWCPVVNYPGVCRYEERVASSARPFRKRGIFINGEMGVDSDAPAGYWCEPKGQDGMSDLKLVCFEEADHE